MKKVFGFGVALLLLLCSCEKEISNPSKDDILGTWSKVSVVYKNSVDAEVIKTTTYNTGEIVWHFTEKKVDMVTNAHFSSESSYTFNYPLLKVGSASYQVKKITNKTMVLWSEYSDYSGDYYLTESFERGCFDTNDTLYEKPGKPIKYK